MTFRFEPVEQSLGGLVAGLDEAGRGALAGPVSVGLAVFEPALFAPEPGAPGRAVLEDLALLDDSKKLSPRRREALLPLVKRHAHFASCAMVSARQIDEMGINPAIEKAMILLVRRFHRALDRSGGALRPLPISLLLDGNYRFPALAAEPGVKRCESIVRGDSRVFSIAAASILAKVLRDARMSRYDRLFPGYGLASHKGYGTEAHRRSMARLGLSPIHRKSYGCQLSLFGDSPTSEA